MTDEDTAEKRRTAAQHLLRLPLQRAPEHRLVRFLVLRLLALTYLIAFSSLWVQIHGLVGERGILPAASYLDAVYERFAGEAYLLRPTVAWLTGAGDGDLTLLCAGGVVLSVAALAGVAQAWVFFALWALYLSLLVVGQLFLSYQWDTLLLEAGFLAVLWAPAGLRPRLPGAEAPPVHAATWLVRWLAFRLMVASGAVKLLSGDSTWRDLTALTHHYQTQPIPNPLAWYAHRLPLIAQQASTVLMYVVEIAVPFLLFAPRRVRAFAVWPLVGLQVTIAATGNYGFFNLLTAILCLSYLDDRALPRWLRARPRDDGDACSADRPWRGLATAPVAVFLVVLSAVPFARIKRDWQPIPDVLHSVYLKTEPFHLVNYYGLVASLRIVRRTVKPKPVGYPENPTTIGEHLKKRRMDLRLRQQDVAPQLGVSTPTLSSWELGHTEPELPCFPSIFSFLGYDPTPEPKSESETIAWLKRSLGLSRAGLAERLGVNERTLLTWEHGSHKPSRRLWRRVEELVGQVQEVRISSILPSHQESNPSAVQ